MDIKEYSKYWIIILFILVIGVSLYIIKDFLLPVFAGLFIAYVVYPIHKRLNLKIGNHWSAILITLVLILILVLPASFVLNAIAKETAATYTVAKQKLDEDKLQNCVESNFFCKSINFFATDSESKKKIIAYIDQGIKGTVNYVISGVTNFALSVPKRMLDLFITIFIMFYYLVDGYKLKSYLKRVFPINKKHRSKIVKKLSDVTYALIYGTILVGVLEGILLAIGFWLSDIASPIMWGTITAFVALIPLLGPTIIWLPGLIIQLYSGHYPSAIGILITGIVVSSIDTILRPKIVGNKANVHPVLVLLGVLGGIKVFGIIGVIVGPLVLTFITTFMQIFEEHL